MKHTKILAILFAGMLITGCDENDIRLEKPAVAVIAPKETPSGKHVKIIDIRKEGDCENETLMERIDTDANYRFSRCGYFGQIGDTFWWVD